jgi:hypothetical protein
MRTTLNISDALLKELREKAQREKRPFRVIVEETLQRGLGHAQPKGRKRKVRIKPYPVGIQSGLLTISLNQLYDQIEAQENVATR